MSTTDVIAHGVATDAELSNNTLDQLCVNTIRTLAMDAVQAGELRPSGNADGPGAGGLLSVAALPALRPRPSDLAQP